MNAKGRLGRTPGRAALIAAAGVALWAGVAAALWKLWHTRNIGLSLEWYLVHPWVFVLVAGTLTAFAIAVATPPAGGSSGSSVYQARRTNSSVSAAAVRGGGSIVKIIASLSLAVSATAATIQPVAWVLLGLLAIVLGVFLTAVLYSFLSNAPERRRAAQQTVALLGSDYTPPEDSAPPTTNADEE
ncbi:hypothetical protein ACFV3R_11415 [Streptomyces sp. NPDC059740]|uniref:hypothetical protein n=1 Tax=Streptomyces sp. NPDC059740 TaxID=3346926 RepID=UPI00365B0A23